MLPAPARVAYAIGSTAESVVFSISDDQLHLILSPPLLLRFGSRSEDMAVLRKGSNLNPIEMPFSKLKASLRKAAERTIPRLRRRIGRFARSLTAREASNYFRHAGYA